MKRVSLLFFVTFALISCQQKIGNNDVAKLNGYWEIERVILPDGEKKEYKINETIDFFEIKNNAGFRKKVMPQFDGSYKVDDLFENIKITKDGDDFFIEYETAYGKWREQILEISDKELVLKNKQDLEYHYKKPIPFTLK